ncbi:MAG: stage II sporulation protein E [Bacillota bacterium]
MFEKTDVYPYRREDTPSYTRRRLKKRNGGAKPLFLRAAGMISPGIIAAGVVAFFVGRAVILGELVPFAAAYAAATAVAFGRQGLPVISLLCAGLATVAGGYRLAADIVLVAFSFLFAQALPPKYSGRRAVIPVMVFGLTLSVKAGFSAFTGSTPYDYINIFFEALLAGVLAPACVVSFSAARKMDGIKPLSGEESVCLLVVLAAMIAGAGDLHLWYVSLKGFLSRTIILLAAQAGGAGLGAAAGAVVGIIPGLSYMVTPYLVGAYSFSGVVAGLGGALGKIGVALFFLASNIILSIYFNSFSSMEAVIAETSLACLVFLLVPEGFVRRFSAAVVREQAAARPDYSREMLKNALREKLKAYSAIFRELARAFGETTAVTGRKDDEQGIKQLLAEIGKKVCDGCGMFHVCWEKDYYRTYQNMLDLFSLTEMYGRVRPSDIPGELKVRCTRPRELAITGACLYEAFKVDRYWRKKLMTGRGVVGDQLRGISAVMDSLAEEFDFHPRDVSDMDAVIKQKLRQLGLPVKAVRISESGGRQEISVTMKACQGELECRYRVAPIISEFIGRLFSATGCVCEGQVGEGICRFLLYQGPQYRVEVGAAGAGRGGSPVSGDVYDFLQLKGGRFAAVLSDGMGSGEDAARESTSLIALVRRMLEAGLEIETAIKSVNSVLALKNPAESFATLDMSVINLYNGQAEFVKIAAPPTFLIRGGKVRAIRASSLPVGILSDIEISVTEKKLASGDVMIMLTDGILDSYRGSRDREDWITGVLEELNGLDPREMAELLLKLAQTGGGGELKIADDMAVVVIRVEKEKVVEIPG